MLLVCRVCIRRWCALLLLLSGEGLGGGLLVYALGAFSLARAWMRAAASSIRVDVFALVMGLPFTPGYKGRGGGALSGSELSHLCRRQRLHSSNNQVELTLGPSSCQIQKKNADA